jgi:hypothetical protein
LRANSTRRRNPNARPSHELAEVPPGLGGLRRVPRAAAGKIR